MSKYQQNEREKLKEKCLNYLGGKKCAKCEARHLPICCYDFHHKKGNKETEISKLINKNTPFNKIKKELDKCKILCANCHREVIYHNINI